MTDNKIKADNVPRVTEDQSGLKAMFDAVPAVGENPAPDHHLRGLVQAFLRAHDDGPGLIDCIDNHGNRYTSQALANTIEEARAALSAPATEVE